MIKILINGVTLEEGNIVPLLLKIKTWQTMGCIISIIGSQKLRERIKEINILIKEYNFIELYKANSTKNKIYFIFESIRRNLILIKNIKYYNNFDLIYSISSVLDLIIFFYFLKILNRKIKWTTVFDNIVSIGEKRISIIRVLALLFFHLSLALIRQADYIFVISEDLKNYLIRRQFDNKKIILTGNGVEVDLIKKSKKLNNYNIDALYVGRINETKGIYDMLKVLKIVKKRYPNFNLSIMGRGDVSSEIKFLRLIKEKKLEDNIKFLGYKTGLEKFNIIKSSKIFLFLSKSESFGVALLEAVCCGLKAVVYELEPYKKIYLNNEVIMVTKNNYSKAADEVLKIIDRSDFENKKGKLLLNKYSWDVIAKKEYEAFI